MKSNFLFFSFIIHAFCVLFFKSLPNPRTLTFSLMFCCCKFIVLTHIQVYDPFWVSFVKWVVVHCFLHIVTNYSSTICWKFFFSSLNCLGILVKGKLATCVALFLDSSIPLICLCVFTWISHCLNNYNFITSLELSVDPLILTFSKLFWLL